MTAETVEAPAFDPIPDPKRVVEPIQDRKPQRELSQSPAAKRAREYRANKGKSKPTRRTSARTARKPASLVQDISAFLSLVNGALIVSPIGTRPVEAIWDASVTPTRVGDELDEVEITALATALDQQCKRSPRFRKVVERMLGAGSGGTLFVVLGMIAARRAARHGLLPATVDMQAGMMLAGDVSVLANMSGPTPTHDDETGETIPDRSATDADE